MTLGEFLINNLHHRKQFLAIIRFKFVPQDSILGPLLLFLYI